MGSDWAGGGGEIHHKPLGLRETVWFEVKRFQTFLLPQALETRRANDS